MTFPTEKELAENTSCSFAMSNETFELAGKYLDSVKKDINAAGTLLQHELSGLILEELTPTKFIQHIINTKKPKNFAEQILVSPGTREQSGYSNYDLQILASIGTVIPSYAYNDGGHYGSFKDHVEPLPCIMGYISAPLFTFARGSLDDVALTVQDGRSIDVNHYNREIEQRLLPMLLQMNLQAEKFGKKLTVTIPGLGCGYFGGPFGDNGDQSVYSHLNNALKRVIETHADKLGNIAGMYFDTYSNIIGQESTNIKGISYQCVASSTTPGAHKQLELSETDKTNPNIMLGTIVAADLISWAGNDMWVDSRGTDEGVKGGSSLTLVQITCSLCPELFKLEDFEYIRGAYKHKNLLWSEIGQHLKTACKYASDNSVISIHDLNAMPSLTNDSDDCEESTNSQSDADQSTVGDQQEDNNSNYPFNFQLLAGLASISVASLVVGVLALASVITAPLGVGVGMIALGCAFGIGATCYGLFSTKGDEGRDSVEDQEQNAFNP